MNNPGEPRWSDLKAVLQQLEDISKLRNNIVHFIPLDGIPGDARHLTNAMRALTQNHRRDIAISPAMLADMTNDLQKTQLHIWYHLLFDRLPKVCMGMLDEQRCAAWRYSAPQG